MKFTLPLILLSLALGFASCSSSDKKEVEVPIVAVDLDQPMMTPEEMAQHFTNDRMVILRGVMLTNIDRLIDWGDRFVVLDRRGQQVAICDTMGNCIRQIKRLGKGPGEYVQLGDCTIDNINDELILYADTPGKLIYFDRDGNYRREEWMSDCYFEIVCMEDDLYGINCGLGRTMAENTVTRMAMKDKASEKETQLSYDGDLPSVASGLWMTTNGQDVWLSRPFDYTLYKLDPKTKRFVPRYKLDLGKAALPKNEIKHDMSLSEIWEKGLVYHVPKVGLVGNYLMISGIGRSGSYMIDLFSGQVLKVGIVPLFGTLTCGIGGYRLLENQNRRILHTIPVDALEIWSEEMKNKGQKNAELEKVMAANEEFMNPVLLFQDVR